MIKSFYLTFFCLTLMAALLGCTHPPESPKDDTRIAEIEKKLEGLKPGFGELMGVVQQHHAKLYYSGSKGNWELAQYQLEEVEEGLEEVVKHYPTFKDVKLPIKELLPKIMDEPLKQLAAAIKNKNKKAFHESFSAMTKSCNACHQATEHGFISVQVPTGVEFTNQKFSP